MQNWKEHIEISWHIFIQNSTWKLSCNTDPHSHKLYVWSGGSRLRLNIFHTFFYQHCVNLFWKQNCTAVFSKKFTYELLAHKVESMQKLKTLSSLETSGFRTKESLCKGCKIFTVFSYHGAVFLDPSLQQRGRERFWGFLGSVQVWNFRWRLIWLVDEGRQEGWARGLLLYGWKFKDRNALSSRARI